jgi:hypothetical protein
LKYLAIGNTFFRLYNLRLYDLNDRRGSIHYLEALIADVPVLIGFPALGAPGPALVALNADHNAPYQ